MKPTVYVETSAISYLTGRASRDVVIAAYQELTRKWWEDATDRFDLFASELVIEEASAGDPDAAGARLDALKRVSLLDITDDAARFARLLVDLNAVPRRAAADAVHIAIAVTNGIRYLVTWNFRHIANAAARADIEQAYRDAGYEPPIICTPNEPMEPDHESEMD